MNRRGKVLQSNLKASRESKPKIESKISISLQYLSTNKQRNFDFFAKNFRDKATSLDSFIKFVQRLTSKTQLEISALSKTDDCGFEQMPFAQINCNPHGVTLGKDTKICVFRFGERDDSDKYRVLGFFDNKQPILHIIGFDFDYSAYKH